MKKMVVALMLVMLVINGCDDSTGVDVPVDDDAANSFAQAGFALLNEKILDIEELNNPQSGDDIFPESDYNLIKTLFEQALAENSNNALANFGMAILEVASINYDEELWDMIDDVDTEFGDGRIFNNQFLFLFEAQLFYINYLNHSQIQYQILR